MRIWVFLLIFLIISSELLEAQGKKDKKDKKNKKNKKGKGKGKDKDKGQKGRGRSAEVYYPPISGQRVRFGGDYSNNASAGNIEVFLRGKWGIVCDDDWGKRDADVVCKQLGFSWGASSFTAESTFGMGSWNDSDILMNNVDCTGTEASIFNCHYSDQTQICLTIEGAGVVCEQNTGCPTGWIGGPDSCYMLSNITTTKKEFAENKCSKAGGYLANIETPAENNFISNAFAGIAGEPIIVGATKSRYWLWERVERSSSSSGWTIARRRRRSPRGRGNAWGRQGRGHSHQQQSSSSSSSSSGRRGSNYGGRSSSSQSSYSFESTVQESFQYYKWFPGWQPFNKNSEPSNKKKDKCLYLTSEFKHPNGGMQDVGYLFWQDDICKRSKKKLKNGFRYLCERAREEEEEMPMPGSRVDDAEECYRGNGETYRGTQSSTLAGTMCIPWILGNKYTPTDYPSKGLVFNYCRNPDSDSRPWCYVDGEGKFGFCDIPKCSDDPGAPQTSPTTPKPTSATTAVPECPDDKFYCSQTRKCISQQWHCDMEPDCEGGEDEVGCDYSIVQFNKLPNRALDKMVIKESFVGVSNETCADICLGRTTYVCRSFAFNQEERKCDISTTNSQETGSPSWSLGTDVFELISQLDNCMGMYTCNNKRCIDNSLLCNGVDDCNDMSDELQCGDTDPVEVRLVDGTDEHSGRVEVKFRGEWGLICDDNWDNDDATVICQMLGYQGVGIAHGHSKYGLGSGLEFLLDEVNCTGLEDSIEECDHPGWKQHDCRFYEVAGVACQAHKSCKDGQFMCSTDKCIDAFDMCDGKCDCPADCEDENGHGQHSCNTDKLEVVNGTKTTALLSGRVEIERNGLRGTVCDDKWDNNDATVVCNMMGFKYGEATAGGAFGPGKGAIWLDDVDCLGTESSLSNCPSSNWGISDCVHSEDAGVVCTNTDPDEDTPVGIRVELVDGPTSNAGRVELIRNGVRGTVCDDEWDNKDATVVCRMLGYSHGTARQGGFYGPGHDSSKIWLDDVVCTGREDSVVKCQHAGWDNSDCAHGEDAGVVCTNTVPGEDEHELDDTWSGVSCGRRPLETNSRKRREVDDDWVEREIAPPKFERIVGGFTASKGFYPWQVGVRKIVQEDEFGNKYHGHWCGGTILSEYWILSAAHCYSDLHKSHVLMRIGDHDNKRDDEFEQEFEVDQLINHRLYNETTFDYDLALIKIKPVNGKGIKFGDHVQPACLPDPDTEYVEGKKCHISGWGQTETGYQNLLKAEKVPFIDDDKCQELYKGEITPNMVCAGYLAGGIDSCAGDSGGPLVCDINGRFTVMGATSFGAGCAEANAPGVYARVTAFLPWIKQTIAKYT